MNNICVYCASSERLKEGYKAAARDLGQIIGQRGKTLVYGGTNIGLMGEVARTTKIFGGQVIGVIPQLIYDRGICNLQADEIIITEDMRQRKATMEKKADAFIALPGGFGTLEEVSEIITHKQLQYHQKPIVFLNTEGFYNPLNDFFEHLYLNEFARPAFRALYHFAHSPEDAMVYLDNYTWNGLENKWN